MTKRRALVLGSTGMLGGTVLKTLWDSDTEVLAASRSRGLIFDAEVESVGDLLGKAGLQSGDFVVNCIGVTKAHICRNSTESLERAIRLNALFPIALARAAEALNVRVIQVATDCVFSGSEGQYIESSAHDAFDAYGKSKSLGEVISKHVMHIRCSLVGPEGEGRQTLFFEWVRAAAPDSLLNGYVNHRWNGLTSLAFARIVAGIIENDTFIPGLHHLVPADELTKYELIKLELEMLKRENIMVKNFSDVKEIDRTLATEQPEVNRLLFASGGYDRVPTIREMMEELPWEALKER